MRSAKTVGAYTFVADALGCYTLMHTESHGDLDELFVAPSEEIPYDGASSMLLVDVEDPDAVAEMVEALLEELSEPRGRFR